MGLFEHTSTGIVLPASAAVDLDILPWRAGLSLEVMLPGVYVVAEPVGDAPWAGTICTNWRHLAGAPAARCDFCGIGWA